MRDWLFIWRHYYVIDSFRAASARATSRGLSIASLRARRLRCWHNTTPIKAEVSSDRVGQSRAESDYNEPMVYGSE